MNVIRGRDNSVVSPENFYWSFGCRRYYSKAELFQHDVFLMYESLFQGTYIRKLEKVSSRSTMQ